MREFIIENAEHLKKLGGLIRQAFDAGFAGNKKVLLTMLIMKFVEKTASSQVQKLQSNIMKSAAIAGVANANNN